MSHNTIKTTLQSSRKFFINLDEHRLRTFWRLLIQFALNFLLIGLLTTIPMYLVSAWIALLDGIPLSYALTSLGAVDVLQKGYEEFPSYLIIRRSISAALIPFLYLLYARLLDRRPLRAYGLRIDRTWWLDLGFGLVLGGLLMGLIYLVQSALGWVQVTGKYSLINAHTPFWIGLAASFISFIFVGLSEELMFRGYQLKNMAEGFRTKAGGKRGALLLAVMGSSLIFGLMHLGNPNANWLSTLNIILWGALAGLSVLWTGQIALAVGMHTSWNFFQGNIFGFPVSGTTPQGSLLVLSQTGNPLLNGGAFGPEGGLICTLAIGLGLILVIGYVYWTRRKLQPQEQLAIYREIIPERIDRESDLARG